MTTKIDPRAMEPISRKSLRVLLPTLGSAGDIHPMIALGLALQNRGHSATIIASPVFQPTIENVGLKFLPVGTLEQAHALHTDPKAFRPMGRIQCRSETSNGAVNRRGLPTHREKRGR